MLEEKKSICPCGSKKPYQECCGLYHLGKSYPQDPLNLMKSRYSAYALGLADYIIKTTHPLNPRYEKDKEAWKKDILTFSNNTQFLGLDILEVLPKRDSDGIAVVMFKVHLKQGSQDTSFTERSYFAELEGKWLYLDGDVFK